MLRIVKYDISRGDDKDITERGSGIISGGVYTDTCINIQSVISGGRNIWKHDVNIFYVTSPATFLLSLAQQTYGKK